MLNKLQIAAMLAAVQFRAAREARYEARRLANARMSGRGAKECARRRRQAGLA